MTRIRLRDARSPGDEIQYYEQVYPQGYKHDRWPDHVERVAASVELIRRYGSQITTAADLSCGDSAILAGIDDLLEQTFVGDLIGARGEYPTRPHVRVLPAGPLPGTLNHLPEQVDLFVLSETLEHMDDPDDLLRQLTRHSRYLFVSTPEDEIDTSGNLEHYWSWGAADVHRMLQDAGWSPIELKRLVPRSTLALEHAYHYQLWMAVKES